MKMSELTELEIMRYLKLDESDVDAAERQELEAFKKAATEYVKSYTGLSGEECDRYEDLTVAVLILIADYYDNRSAYLPSNQAQISRAVDNILGLHQVNLL